MQLYYSLTDRLSPVFDFVLRQRLGAGKADVTRAGEYKGLASRLRPVGDVVWLHAASVGEAQSSLALIRSILTRYPQVHIVVTTGTRTSADMMAKSLPTRAFHQFAPLDRPDWVGRFLDFWRPCYALWMESELWPNMLKGLKDRGIPAALVNARMSARSASRWKLLGGAAKDMLSAFDMVFAQGDDARAAYTDLGARGVQICGNIKYSAAPLPYDELCYGDFIGALNGRPLWVYASSHAGEEALACRVHEVLRIRFPDVLTVIVPRHPERRREIAKVCDDHGLAARLRGRGRGLPEVGDDIYIADTLGELGLFYRASPIAMIGRSFSDDGGGGHNPLEAAQLGAAVVTGKHVQYQADIYHEMERFGAAVVVDKPDYLEHVIGDLMADPERLQRLQNKGSQYVSDKAGILGRVTQPLFSAMDDVVTASF